MPKRWLLMLRKRFCKLWGDSINTAATAVEDVDVNAVVIHVSEDMMETAHEMKAATSKVDIDVIGAKVSNNLVQAAEEMKAATLTLDVGKVIT